MQRGKVLNLSSFNKAISFTSQNKIMLLVVASFIIGLVFGVSNYGKYEALDSYSKSLLSSFITLRQTSGLFKVFISSLLSSVGILFVCFALGSSMFGMVSVPLILAIKGYVYGAQTAYLYSEFSFKGVAFNAVLVMPSAIFLIIALILSSEQAVKFSLALARLTVYEDEHSGISVAFKKYCIKFLTVLVLLFISAAADMFLSHNFLDNFNF